MQLAFIEIPEIVERELDQRNFQEISTGEFEELKTGVRRFERSTICSSCSPGENGWNDKY